MRTRLKVTFVVLAALAVAAFGTVRLITSFTAPSAEAAPIANIDGLATQVVSANWVDMGHDMAAPTADAGPGYQMPPGMMPGMPTDGKDRLQVTVAVTNTTDQTRPFRAAEEFALYAGKDGQRWEMYGHTFGELPRLAPGSAVNGILFFDVLAAEVVNTPMSLEWNHDGTVTRIGVYLGGTAPAPHDEHNGGY